jgi:hypothetical protein
LFAIPTPIAGAKPSRDLAAYTGTYEEPAYGKVVVSLEKDALVMKWNSFTIGLDHFQLHEGVAQLETRAFGVFAGLFGLLGADRLVLEKNGVHGFGATRFFFEFAPQTQIVFALALEVGEAQHGLGHLVEQVLRFIDVLARSVLADVGIELFVIGADLLDCVFELHEPQQLIMVGRPRAVGDPQPLFVDVNRQCEFLLARVVSPGS